MKSNMVFALLWTILAILFIYPLGDAAACIGCLVLSHLHMEKG